MLERLFAVVIPLGLAKYDQHRLRACDFGSIPQSIGAWSYQVRLGNHFTRCVGRKNLYNGLMGFGAIEN